MLPTTSSKGCPLVQSKCMDALCVDSDAGKDRYRNRKDRSQASWRMAVVKSEVEALLLAGFDADKHV